MPVITESQTSICADFKSIAAQSMDPLLSFQWKALSAQNYEKIFKLHICHLSATISKVWIDIQDLQKAICQLRELWKKKLYYHHNCALQTRQKPLLRSGVNADRSQVSEINLVSWILGYFCYQNHLFLISNMYIMNI